jgi:hypothetical protein
VSELGSLQVLIGLSGARMVAMSKSVMSHEGAAY